MHEQMTDAQKMEHVLHWNMIIAGMKNNAIPAVVLHDVFVHKSQFSWIASELGHDPASLPRENGQRYFDWVGGGIRYWDGWREMPSGR